MNKLTSRRQAILHGVKLLSAVALLPAAAQVRAAEPACVQEDSDSLRQSLNYADPSPDTAKTCSACGFFTKASEGSCGACMIMSGPVNGTAHCDSWSERS